MRFIPFSLFFLLSYQMYGVVIQVQDTMVNEESKSNFLIYNVEENEFMRYSQGENAKVNNIFFPLVFDEIEHKKLLIQCASSISLFLDNKLLGNHPVYKFDVDSLSRVVDKEECLLTFNFGKEEIDLSKIMLTIKDQDIIIKESSINILPKTVNYFSDFVLLGFLSLLILMTLTKTYALKNYKDLVAIERMYSLNVKEENIFRNAIFSYTNGYIIILYSLVASFSFCVIIGQGTQATFSFYINKWLLTATIVAMVVVLKMVIIGLFSRVFNMGKLFEIHYYEYLRITLFISFVVAVFSLIFGLSDAPDNAYHLLTSAWIILIIIRISILFFKLNSLVSYQFFHLFSYLCATEILPFFWLVQSGYHFFG